MLIEVFDKSLNIHIILNLKNSLYSLQVTPLNNVTSWNTFYFNTATDIKFLPDKSNNVHAKSNTIGEDVKGDILVKIIFFFSVF